MLNMIEINMPGMFLANVPALSTVNWLIFPTAWPVMSPISFCASSRLSWMF